MAKAFTAHIQAKRTRASFHEAGHIRVALAVAPGSTINASVNEVGGGDATTIFPEGTSRPNKLEAAVAGFLAEAKGTSGKTLSNDRARIRQIAVDIDRELRSGRQAFQVDVPMTDGSDEPSSTNAWDFAFLLEDQRNKAFNFSAFFGRDSWANEIENAIQECIARLEGAAFWATVTATSNHLLEHGWFSNLPE